MNTLENMSCSPPSKKIKLSLALWHELDSESSPPFSGHNVVIPLLLMEKLVVVIVTGASGKQNHIRVGNFYEEWIDKYLNYDFFQLFRMKRESVYKFLSSVGQVQVKLFSLEYHRGGVNKVPLEKALLMSLWYLGKGETISSVSDRFNVSPSSTHENIAKCIEYIVKLLPVYIKWPTFEEQIKISKDFEELAGFPGNNS